MNGKVIGIPRYYMKIIEVPENTRQRLADESIERMRDKLKKEMPDCEELVNGDYKDQNEFIKKLQMIRNQRRLNLLAQQRVFK